MDITAPYNIYKWYNESRRRWEVRLRQQTVSTRVFHSEKEAEDYMEEVRSVMQQQERVTRKFNKKSKSPTELKHILDFS